MNSEIGTVAALPEAFSKLAPNYVAPDPYDAPSLRWGILGAGGIARVFARDVALYSNQKIVAVGSRLIDRAEQFAAELDESSIQAYGSYEDLVAADDVDVIYVATPHIRHKEDALLALRAGKPVLVEKSFTMNAAEAKEVFDEAAARNLFAMEAMWSRHLPHYAFMREVVANGNLGKLKSVEADHGQLLTHVARLIEPLLGGGALLDLGVYPVHLIHMLLGTPKSQTSFSRLTATDVDSADMIISQYEDALAVAECEFDAKSPTAATLSFEGGIIKMPTEFYRPTPVHLTVHERSLTNGSVTSSTEYVWDATVPGGFQYQAAEAARQIVAGNLESPVVPWSATLEVQAIMDQVLADAKSK